jgi:predicted dinucleotide-binding enzyme
MKHIQIYEEFVKEMSLTDVHASKILNHLKGADEEETRRCNLIISGNKDASIETVTKDIQEMGYHEIEEVEKEIFAISPKQN